MKVQAFIILGLVATVLAVPNFRSRRNASDTADAPGAVDCGSGAPTGLNGLLSQLGTLLDNIVANVGKIQIAGVLGDNSLINLSGLLDQVSILLITLLGGSGPKNNDTAENRGLVSSLIGSITTLLNSLLGGTTGDQYACTNNGGLIGKVLGNLQSGLTGGLLTPVLILLQGLIASLL